MIYAWIFILLMLNVCWLAGALFALPGNWLMVVSTVLFAWWRWDDGIFGIGVLVAIAVLALIGEIIDFFAGTGGARRAGDGWTGTTSITYPTASKWYAE